MRGDNGDGVGVVGRQCPAYRQRKRQVVGRAVVAVDAIAVLVLTLAAVVRGAVNPARGVGTIQRPPRIFGVLDVVITPSRETQFLEILRKSVRVSSKRSVWSAIGWRRTMHDVGAVPPSQLLSAKHVRAKTPPVGT